MLTLGTEANKAFAEILRKFVEGKGVVELSERGTSRRVISTEDQTTGVKAFAGAVKKLMDADKNLSYADAAGYVATENPELYNNYRASQLVGE
jgi:predicted nucleic acid-binding protein